MHHLQRGQAEYAARSFGKYLIQQLPDFERIMADGGTDAAGRLALAAIKPAGTVVKFKLFDRDGQLRVDSTPYAAGHLVSEDKSFVDVSARDVARTGGVSFSLERGDGSVLPATYSEVMVPIQAGGRQLGVLAVLTDETASWWDLFERSRSVFAEALLLVLLAFGVPAGLYLRKRAQFDATHRHLRHSAQHDELTGLINRTGFSRVLAEEIEAAGRHGYSVGVHVIDLDRFQDVNDSNGHAVGDEVLQQVASRLRRLLGSREQLARLGADEFAIVQPYYSESREAVSGLGHDLARALAQPFVVGETTVQIGGSVGHACYPGDGATASRILRLADVALHHAKSHFRGRAIPFSPSMEAARQNRRRIEARLRTALANGEFELNFQPVFELKSGRLRGFETLLRLTNDNGEPISPAEFIPVAEEVGLIADIGVWVLREACRVARQWPDELFVAVNLSPAQFTQGGMAKRVREALDWSGLNPERLELEVTESLLIADSDKVMRELQAMKGFGTTLALDDFGTGYSSLSYLWRFPFDKLKVDRSFMADLTAPGPKSREILSTIIALGRVLNLSITAEGVETEAQAAALRELDCDLVQGFLFGRPQPASEVAATILKAFGGSTRAGRARAVGSRRRTSRV